MFLQKLFALITCCLITAPLLITAQNQNLPLPETVPGAIILKMKEQYRNVCSVKNVADAEFQKCLKQFDCKQINKIFPNHKKPKQTKNNQGYYLVDLSLVYELNISASVSVQKAVQSLLLSGFVEYAEPRYMPQSLYLPNDNNLNQQYYLAKIHALQAWDTCKGDSSVVIGIVDSGTDWDHEDLVGNIAYNYDDPPDGIDNDNDNYTDNFRGWDLGEMDNDPQVAPGGGNSSHGAHICGLAAAETDNNAGIAGTGFKCRFLPVKVADEYGRFVRPFEGIVYAADQGCKVINCSWGAPYSAGQFGLDVVNYAAYNCGAVVVASAGNSNNDVLYYPASYPNVLSVAASDANDQRMQVSNTYGSNYGFRIDVCSPGKDIFSTWDYPYFYKSLSGTSMAAGIASGAAAILCSRYPNDNPQQIIERLRVYSDCIDTLPANIPYMDKLGMGRINLERAVNSDNLSGLRIRNWSVVASSGNEPLPGDTISLVVSYVNHLADAVGAQIQLSCTDTSVSIILGTTTPLTIHKGDSVLFNFKLCLHTGFIPSTLLNLKFTANDNLHSVFEFITIDPVKDYLTVENGPLRITMTGKGKIGYNDALHQQGIGFTFNSGLSWLYSGGFACGTGYANVSDALCNDNNTGFDMDFCNTLKLHFLQSPLIAGKESYCRFNDSLAGILSLGTDIIQKTYTWNDTEDEDYVVVEYSIINTNPFTLNNLYAGIFLDWDLETFHSNYNHVAWDSTLHMGYAFQDGGYPLAGLALISQGNARHYAFDMDGSNGSFNLYDGFTSTEKYNALKGGRDNAGTAGIGNDIADMVSSGPYNLSGGDTLSLAWVITAATYLDALRDNVIIASNRYYESSGIRDTQEGIVNVSVYPNPAFSSLQCSVVLASAGAVGLSITDMYGHTRILEKPTFLNQGRHIFNISLEKAGIFWLTVESVNGRVVKKIVSVM